MTARTPVQVTTALPRAPPLHASERQNTHASEQNHCCAHNDSAHATRASGKMLHPPCKRKTYRKLSAARIFRKQEGVVFCSQCPVHRFCPRALPLVLLRPELFFCERGAGIGESSSLLREALRRRLLPPLLRLGLRLRLRPRLRSRWRLRPFFLRCSSKLLEDESSPYGSGEGLRMVRRGAGAGARGAARGAGNGAD